MKTGRVPFHAPGVVLGGSVISTNTTGVIHVSSSRFHVWMVRPMGDDRGTCPMWTGVPLTPMTLAGRTVPEGSVRQPPMSAKRFSLIWTPQENARSLRVRGPGGVVVEVNVWM